MTRRGVLGALRAAFEPASLRRPPSRRVFLLALVLLVGVGLVHPGKSSGAAPPSLREAALDLGPGGGSATLEFPFSLEQGAAVYAKLLPTPWNPALPAGAANGSVSADRSAGAEGWWVRFQIVTAEGEALDLGHHADGAPTPAVPLTAGDHTLLVTVHAPPAAGPSGAAYRVDVALVQRGGGGVDPSWSLAAVLHVARATAPPAEAPVALVALAAGALGAGGVGYVALRRARAPDDWL